MSVGVGTIASTTAPVAAGAPAAAPRTVDCAIVVPAFNEGDAIGVTIERLEDVLINSPYTYEIVVVNDGSTDDTQARAEAHGAARVVNLPQNRGYGAALKAGIASSNSEFVVIIDADRTYPPSAIPALMAEAEDADMVVGARTLHDTSIPRERRAAKWFLGRLASYLAGRRIPDLNSGLRVMRRSMLMQFLPILPSGFSFTTTITMSCLCTGRRVVYLPVVCEPRVGHSKIRPRDFTAFLLLVLRTVILFNPLKVFLPIGSVLFGIGVAKGLYDLATWNLTAAPFMAVLTAVIVWSVGLLADMTSRLHLQPPQVQR